VNVIDCVVNVVGFWPQA